VFLCTTGAEALYSDLGHCGRKNIQISWIYVKTCLILNYLGQAVWLLQHTGQSIDLSANNPFYKIMPEWFLIFGIGIATLAAVIASQALISGSFTLIAEAVRLNLWPKVRINYPSEQKGQLYVPSVNWLLCFGCIGVVLLFRHSSQNAGGIWVKYHGSHADDHHPGIKILQRKKANLFNRAYF
jgi:KUP system potassium uptake protein